MGSSEKFCLRWNDFESNISVAFRELREEKDFFDCTLSCGSRQIQAHKLILSACSPFFRSILRQNPHQHPLLYLKGVEFTDIQAVLNFMYHGEVNVAQEELNSFLAVAEDLKVKGLTQGNSSDSNNSANSSSSKPKLETPSLSRPPQLPAREERSRIHKRPRPPVERYQDDDEIQEVMPVVKQEPVPDPEPNPPTPSQPLVTQPPQNLYHPNHTSYQDNTHTTTSYQDNTHTTTSYNTVAQMEESYGDDGYDYGGYEGEEYEGATGSDQSKDFVAEEYIQKMGEGIANCVCTLCGKDFIQKSDAKRHIIAKHSGIQQQVACSICCKTFKNQQTVKSHMRQTHGYYSKLN